MATPPTSDDMLDAIAADVQGGVKSHTTDGQTTTLETPTERLAAEARLRTARAAAFGWGGLARPAKAVPPGAV